jgi:hypothetical protein
MPWPIAYNVPVHTSDRLRDGAFVESHLSNTGLETPLLATIQGSTRANAREKISDAFAITSTLARYIYDRRQHTSRCVQGTSFIHNKIG